MLNLQEFVLIKGTLAHNFNESAVLLAYGIYQVSRNHSKVECSDEELKVFAQKMLQLIRSIGITKNKKNELKSIINSLPL
jgi:hypothetical protein